MRGLDGGLFERNLQRKQTLGGEQKDGYIGEEMFMHLRWKCEDWGVDLNSVLVMLQELSFISR